MIKKQGDHSYRCVKQLQQRLKMAALLSTGCRMILGAVLCLTATSTALFPAPTDPAAPNPELFMDTLELARSYGFPIERHVVTTEDGYVLELHRIPHGRWSRQDGHRWYRQDGRRWPAQDGYLRRQERSFTAGNTPWKSNSGQRRVPARPVVLIEHGHGSSSIHSIMMGPKQGLGLVLASQGYDVWLGNSRGNVYSRRHLWLDPDLADGAFWNYSWHEMGVFDCPAQIDYILAATGETGLFAVGYSQGATQLLVLAAERPEYNAKIRAMFLLAPLAFFTRSPSRAQPFLAVYRDTRWLEKLLGVREEKPATVESILQQHAFCGDGSFTQPLCVELWFALNGCDPDQLNVTTLPVVVAHSDGGSTKPRLHYFQLAASRQFQQYDLGRAGNLAAYGTTRPPRYDLSKVTAPVALHYSSNDVLVEVEDVDILHEQLANPIGKFLVPYAKFSHLDFLVAIDVKRLLFDQISRLMLDY